MTAITIVMYHYVRPIRLSHYPEIKGLEVSQFAEQLGYLQRHYAMVTPRQLMEAVAGGAALPPKAALLTFDDGYRDHHDHVFPMLRDRGLSGAFYPPANAIQKRKILDVNKIHFILASEPDKNKLAAEIDRTVDEARVAHGLLSAAEYRAKCDVCRYDTPEVVYIKRMLQTFLPEDLRNEITDKLFQKFVSADEAAFADELYINEAQLQRMLDGGMHIGAHGSEHYWLGHLDPARQTADIDAAISFLGSLGVPRDDFSFCYPYGSFDSATLEILRARDCRFALTTVPGIADATPENALILPRLDTNDLPKDGTAPANEWTLKA